MCKLYVAGKRNLFPLQFVALAQQAAAIFVQFECDVTGISTKFDNKNILSRGFVSGFVPLHAPLPFTVKYLLQGLGIALF